ncbi:glycosyltransferase family 1 protein [Gonapodya prolifera JEL478]|uniref:Glycosyltransferase family 1 protein n=1 Tax=Gonapodya prolifera (strain JEL478) TaxID=1344416 RepID=A0A139A472_GONPJ|nr:glycosyltransferase family 1 protein [Gonapodya prolifera JEL478]|eukprot:KXS11514.1 glycosyltransferase family 1 protein [Gonapodya prolifera JEL478]
MPRRFAGRRRVKGLCQACTPVVDAAMTVEVPTTAGTASGSDANVRLAATHALEQLMNGVGQRVDDSPFLDDSAESLVLLNKDTALGVRLKATWALANVNPADGVVVCKRFVVDRGDCFLDSCKSTPKSDNDNRETFPDDLILSQLLASATSCCADNDKCRSNGVRTVGNLLRKVDAEWAHRHAREVDAANKVLVGCLKPAYGGRVVVERVMEALVGSGKQLGEAEIAGPQEWQQKEQLEKQCFFELDLQLLNTKGICTAFLVNNPSPCNHLLCSDAERVYPGLRRIQPTATAATAFRLLQSDFARSSHMADSAAASRSSSARNCPLPPLPETVARRALFRLNKVSVGSRLISSSHGKIRSEVSHSLGTKSTMALLLIKNAVTVRGEGGTRQQTRNTLRSPQSGRFGVKLFQSLVGIYPDLGISDGSSPTEALKNIDAWPQIQENSKKSERSFVNDFCTWVVVQGSGVLQTPVPGASRTEQGWIVGATGKVFPSPLAYVHCCERVSRQPRDRQRKKARSRSNLTSSSSQRSLPRTNSQMSQASTDDHIEARELGAPVIHAHIEIDDGDRDGEEFLDDGTTVADNSPVTDGVSVTDVNVTSLDATRVATETAATDQGEQSQFMLKLFKAREPIWVPRLNVVITIVGSRGATPTSDVMQKPFSRFDSVRRTTFIALGKRLQQPSEKHPWGHRVRITTHETFRKFVLDSGLEFSPLAGDPAELMAYMVKNPGLLSCYKSILAGDIGKKRSTMRAVFSSLCKACTKSEYVVAPFAADVIISNPPAFGHIHVAEKLGIPLHIFFTMPWSPTAAFPHPLTSGEMSWISPAFLLRKHRSGETNYQLTAFLAAKDKPIVDIGFGSIVVDDPDKLTETIFEAVARPGVKALVSKGWGGLGGSDLSVPDDVYMIASGRRRSPRRCGYNSNWWGAMVCNTNTSLVAEWYFEEANIVLSTAVLRVLLEEGMLKKKNARRYINTYWDTETFASNIVVILGKVKGFGNSVIGTIYHPTKDFGRFLEKFSGGLKNSQNPIERRSPRKSAPAFGIGSGLLEGTKSFTFCLAEGLTGILVKPIVGAWREGAIWAAKDLVRVLSLLQHCL